MSNSCLDEKKFGKKCPPPMDCCGKDILFRKVVIPIAMGDDTQYPPQNGAFRNALVEYEANHAIYIYSSDGLYTKLSVPSGVTSVNGMYGDVTLDIPEKVSDLVNDLGYVTKNVDNLVNYTKTSSLASVALSGSYLDLSNKPAINNGELTITRNGSALGSFKANQSQNVTMNVQVPTTTAELINNSQFVVDAHYVHTDKNFTTSLNNKLNHLADIYEIGDNLTLVNNRLNAVVPPPVVTDYDASWLFTTETASQAQYNALYNAIQSKKRIYMSNGTETYNVLAYINNESDLAAVINIGGIDTYSDVIYADNIVGFFYVDKDTLEVSVDVGETSGASLARAIASEANSRSNADTNLQSQIDAITVSSDVVDVVGTYAELQQYDTSHLKDNDIVKVLQDSTHSNAMSYYRWVISGGTGSFQYVGSEGPFYTKSETDTKVNTTFDGQTFTTVQSVLNELISEFADALDTKQNTITSDSKLDSDLVDDTNQTNKFVTESDKTTWSGKADYGFTGIITGTATNPTDGASLANGTYLADPSKVTSYINLLMEDGTTKRQSVQKGGIVIRTAGRLIVLATQNLLYQYNTSQHYFYEGEPIVESYTRTPASDDQAYLGTVAPPNNKLVTDPVYLLDGEINTGTTGHVRIIFTVVDDLQGEDFAYSLTLSSGEDILYEDGAEPNFKEGHTYMLEFYGSTCQVLDFTESTGYSRDDLLKQFMRRNSDQIYYPSLDGKPNFSVQKAAGNAEDNRNVNITNSDIFLTNFQGLQYYGINGTAIPLDLSLYNVAAAQHANQLQPHTQLPDGVYYVTNKGRIWLGAGDVNSYEANPGELIYKTTDEVIIIGYYAACYFSWNSTDQAYEGGYFTTTLDVEYMLEDYEKGMTVTKSTTATGNITMTDRRWTRKTRAAGINSATINFPNEETIDDVYKSRFTCKTSSTFTSFNITSRSYTIYFVGDDCSNGTITASAGKYYDMHAEADGFGGVLVHVTSYTLPST